MSDTADYRLVLQPEGFYSVDPLPDPQALADFYAQLYFQSPQSATYHTAYSPAEIEQRYLRGRVTIHAIERASGSGVGKRFLEVGCGEGFLLKVAHESGYQVKGVDFSDFGLQRFNPDMAGHMEAGNPLEILERIVEQGERCDVCVIQNVLEHVIDPRALIGQLRRSLRPDGIAVISVPNDFSRIQLRAQELGLIDRQFWVAPPQHLHYFNTVTLGPFLKTMGLEPLESFGDFPIEFFLYHQGSNYIADAAAGKHAHKARVELDLLLAENGVAALYELWQAMTRCGIGRNVTILARPARQAGS